MWGMPALSEIDLNLLYALAVMIEEGSVTAAAARLGVTQPAMSHKLRRLREAFGDTLLVTGRGRLVPTERAQAMVEPLRSALGTLSDMIADEEPFDPEEAEHEFVIASADLLEIAFLPKMLAFVRAEAPGVRLRVVSHRRDVYEGLRLGAIHVAFGPSFEPHPGLRQSKIFEESFVVIGRRRHPAFSGGLTLDRYLQADHLLIAPEGTSSGVVDAVLATLGLSRRVALRIGHFSPAPFLVANGDLLLAAPKSLATAARQYLPLSTHPLPIQVGSSPTMMVWHERFDRDPAHRWFRESVRGQDWR